MNESISILVMLSFNISTVRNFARKRKKEHDHIVKVQRVNHSFRVSQNQVILYLSRGLLNPLGEFLHTLIVF